MFFLFLIFSINILSPSYQSQVLSHYLTARRTQGKDGCSEVGHDIQQVQGKPFLRTFSSFLKAEDKREFRADQHLPSMSGVRKLPIIFTTKGEKQKVSQCCAYFSLEKYTIKKKINWTHTIWLFTICRFHLNRMMHLKRKMKESKAGWIVIKNLEWCF